MECNEDYYGLVYCWAIKKPIRRKIIMELGGRDGSYQLRDYPAGTRRSGDVPWRFPKGSNVGDLWRTFRGLLEDRQKIDDLMKKVFFRCSSLYFTHLLHFFYWKNKYSKVLNRDVHSTYTGPSCGTSRGPNDGTLWGRPRNVGHMCFLNSTQKHIKLTLIGYSRLSSELW